MERVARQSSRFARDSSAGNIRAHQKNAYFVPNTPVQPHPQESHLADFEQSQTAQQFQCPLWQSCAAAFDIKVNVRFGPKSTPRWGRIRTLRAAAR